MGNHCSLRWMIAGSVHAEIMSTAALLIVSGCVCACVCVSGSRLFPLHPAPYGRFSQENVEPRLFFLFCFPKTDSNSLPEKARR